MNRSRTSSGRIVHAALVTLVIETSLFGLMSSLLWFVMVDDYVVEPEYPQDWEPSVLAFVSSQAADVQVRHEVYESGEIVSLSVEDDADISIGVWRVSGSKERPWSCTSRDADLTVQSVPVPDMENAVTATEVSARGGQYFLRCQRDWGVVYLVRTATYFLRPSDIRFYETSGRLQEVYPDIAMSLVMRQTWQFADADVRRAFRWQNRRPETSEGRAYFEHRVYEEEEPQLISPFDSPGGVIEFKDVEKMRTLERNVWIAALVWSTAGGIYVSETLRNLRRLSESLRMRGHGDH